MSSVHPTEGTITGKPYQATHHGRLNGPDERSGRIHGACDRNGSIRGAPMPNGLLQSGSGESPENAAMAELSGLISTLGSYSAQAQSLPLSPPTPPSLPQGGYQPQPTDYTQFAGDSN
jgi:hypothetical protein